MRSWQVSTHQTAMGLGVGLEVGLHMGTPFALRSAAERGVARRDGAEAIG